MELEGVSYLVGCRRKPLRPYSRETLTTVIKCWVCFTELGSMTGSGSDGGLKPRVP